jgi:hypothetical protein
MTLKNIIIRVQLSETGYRELKRRRGDDFTLAVSARGPREKELKPHTFKCTLIQDKKSVMVSLKPNDGFSYQDMVRYLNQEASGPLDHRNIGLSHSFMKACLRLLSGS